MAEVKPIKVRVRVLESNSEPIQACVRVLESKSEPIRVCVRVLREEAPDGFGVRPLVLAAAC